MKSARVQVMHSMKGCIRWIYVATAHKYLLMIIYELSGRAYVQGSTGTVMTLGYGIVEQRALNDAYLQPM